MVNTDSEIKVSLCSTLLIHYFCFLVFHFLSGTRNAVSCCTSHVKCAKFLSVPIRPTFSRPLEQVNPGSFEGCCPEVAQLMSLILHWDLLLATVSPLTKKPLLQWEF